MNSEIVIITGPGGAVDGSQVFVNGERQPDLAYFAVAPVDGYWQVTRVQLAKNHAEDLHPNKSDLASKLKTFDDA